MSKLSQVFCLLWRIIIHWINPFRFFPSSIFLICVMSCLSIPGIWWLLLQSWSTTSGSQSSQPRIINWWVNLARDWQGWQAALLMHQSLSEDRTLEEMLSWCRWLSVSWLMRISRAQESVWPEARCFDEEAQVHSPAPVHHILRGYVTIETRSVIYTRKGVLFNHVAAYNYS